MYTRLKGEINISTSGDNTIINAPGIDQKIRILQYTIIASGAVDITFKAGSRTIFGPVQADSTSGVQAPKQPNEEAYFELDLNEGWIINLSDSVQVGGSYIAELVDR